jgi:hypothetical protein
MIYGDIYIDFGKREFRDGSGEVVGDFSDLI